MATPSGITKTASGEIIPKLEMENFEAAILKLESIEELLAAVDRSARALAVQDQTTFTDGGVLVAQVKNAEKDAEDELAPFKKIIKRAQDFVRQREQRVTNKAKLIRDELNRKMGDYTRAEEEGREAERRREQAKKDAETKRLSEVKRQQDKEAAAEAKEKRVKQIRQDYKDGKIGKRESAKLLKEAGATEEAAKAQAAADAEEAAKQALTVKVEANIPSVSGVVKRKNFKGKVVNIGKLHVKYLKADEVKIGIDVRGAVGDGPENELEAQTIKRIEALIPGIEVTCERTF